MTMSADTSLFDGTGSGKTRLQRAAGRARVEIENSDGLSRVKRVFQEGAAKIRFPKTIPGSPPEAVIINTAGGLTGGDTFSVEAGFGDGAVGVITSQACEKVYKSSGGAAQVDNRLRLGKGAVCAWLPQETILFDRARLERSLDIDMADDAALLAVEPLILGRKAMGETVKLGRLRDRWRIRRAGRLLHADDLRLDGDIDQLTRAAPLLAGFSCAASVVLVTPDAEDHLDSVRDLLETLDQGDGQTGASSWEGRLVVRLLADSGMMLRCVLIPLLRLLLERLTHKDGTAACLPRVWTT